MLKIYGRRGSGKTYTIIMECHKRDCDILVSTKSQANYINKMIADLNITNVKAVTVVEPHRKYMIDEIDFLLERAYGCNIIGFSCNIDASNIVLTGDEKNE